MRIIARYQPDGGWKCILRDSGGEECRTDVMARMDIETHLLIDHAIKEIRPLDNSMHMYGTPDPAVVDRLGNAGGL